MSERQVTALAMLYNGRLVTCGIEYSFTPLTNLTRKKQKKIIIIKKKQQKKTNKKKTTAEACFGLAGKLYLRLH